MVINLIQILSYLNLNCNFSIYVKLATHHLSAPPKPNLASQQQTSSSYPKPLPRPVPSQRPISQFRRPSPTSNIKNQKRTPISSTHHRPRSRSPLSPINNTQSTPKIGTTKRIPKKIQPRSQENPVESTSSQVQQPVKTTNKNKSSEKSKFPLPEASKQWFF